jgi:hypothetical protein
VNLFGVIHGCHFFGAGDGETGDARPRRQRRLGGGLRSVSRAVRLCDDQVRRARPLGVSAGGAGPLRDRRHRHLPGLRRHDDRGDLPAPRPAVASSLAPRSFPGPSPSPADCSSTACAGASTNAT